MITASARAVQPGIRDTLRDMFAGHRRHRVWIDAVLETGMGDVAFDTEECPALAALALNGGIVLAGDYQAQHLADFVRCLPGHAFAPESSDWLEALRRVCPWPHEERERFDFSAHALDRDHLHTLSRAIPDGYALVRVDANLAPHLLFTVAYESAEEFLANGVGFCTLNDGDVVCTALSY